MSKKFNDNSLIEYQSFFWSPDYLEATSAWIEHIPFGFWIIEVLKPRVVVELGIHSGTSYFAFCQAVKTLNIDTSCYGVDTWKGDEHAGFYGEEVFETVTNHNTKEFSRFSTLIRSTFDEAKEYFIDDSIDLLHIDGLHTYEAVKHDFENWLPKLSERGLVMLHDINVREKNFGVFKLWEELKQKYQHFQFDFGYGLGIISAGKIIQEELKELFNESKNGAYYRFLKNIFSERGNFFKVSSHNESLLKKQKESVKTLAEANAELTETKQVLESHNRQLEERNRELEIQKGQLEGLFANLELTNKELQKKYGVDKAELLGKIRTTGVLLKNISDELAVIKKENELFKKHITWYRDTYETRSLLGVLKEKIRYLFKKKLNHRPPERLDPSELNSQPTSLKAESYLLNPANDVDLLNKDVYTVTGDDPFFLVDLKNKSLNRGWYWLRIEVTKQEGILEGPKLYLNYGQGFNEDDAWELSNFSNGKIESLIEFSGKIKQLRFDPTTTRCSFTIREFHLKPISKIKAFQIALSKGEKNHSSVDSPFFAFPEFVSTLVISGFRGINRKIKSFIIEERKKKNIYTEWCVLYDTISEPQLNAIESLAENLAYQPRFSIIMPVYDPPLNYLKRAIDSVAKQAYKNWELCIADDKSSNSDVRKLLKRYQLKDNRIKIVFRDTNGHISNASNSALELAGGEYIVLLDQDDELRPHSLYMVAKAINENRKLELIYSDEDKIDEHGNRFDPYFKTDWNKDLFYGQNMISHLGVYKHSLIKKIKGFREGYEGSQDYDLALRCLEYVVPDHIHHIPHILYHWRALPGSTSVKVSNKNYALDAGIRALKDHLNRRGENADVKQNVNESYRVKWKLPDPVPMVSIIIPTKDKVEVLYKCVTSILEKTQYKNFEIVIIDNVSEDPLALEYLKTTSDNKRIRVYEYQAEFNFSAIVNYGVQQSKGDIIVLMNNDTEAINENWLSEMVSQCLREEIGVVGAKLYYPSGQIQHAGVFLFDEHPGIHIYLQKNKNDPGYFNKLNLVQNYSAVTAACLAVRKELYFRVNGFDEKNLKIAYNDVDFCLKIRELGYRNLWTPFAQLIHHESLSRGNDLDESNFIRFRKEHSYMLEKWKNIISNDPFFNPNLGPDTRTNQLAFPPRVKYQWQ